MRVSLKRVASLLCVSVVMELERQRFLTPHTLDESERTALKSFAAHADHLSQLALVVLMGQR
jgi:hypothetical protein